MREGKLKRSRVGLKRKNSTLSPRQGVPGEHRMGAVITRPATVPRSSNYITTY
ncbi:hypothetical protein [Nitrosomonas communis]|uniref:hypothetical protein n=1 Tax=Nitrosomonas communis TaxID=44574 RepID=UPI00147BEC6A|nr:hypothetical protein [Nitrosomonas communis]